jgi:FkbM family methyltransferase
METVRIEAYDRAYLINNPGAGRVGSKLEHGEPYERRLLVDIYQQQRTGSAFDVGAHIGNHSLYLAAICGLRVYAFEPHPASLEQLRANVALNPDLEIEVLPWAAGDRHTVGRLTRAMWLEFDPTRNGASLKLDRGEVEVHPIDDMLEVSDLSVVKVDVEGMEPDVLRGLVRHLSRSRPVVYAETHTNAAYRATADVLEPLGYQRTRVLHLGSPQHRWEYGG